MLEKGSNKIGVDDCLVERERCDVDRACFDFWSGVLGDSCDFGFVIDSDVILFKNVRDVFEWRAVRAITLVVVWVGSGHVRIGTIAVPKFKTEKITISRTAVSLQVRFGIVLSVEAQRVIVDDLKRNVRARLVAILVEVNSLEGAVEVSWIVEVGNGDASGEHFMAFSLRGILRDAGRRRHRKEPVG